MAAISKTEFLEKYSDPVLMDQDLFQAGLQSKDPTQQAMARHDFWGLNTQDRYETLVHLEKEEKWEGIRYLVIDSKRSMDELISGIRSEGYSYIRSKDDEDGPNLYLWDARFHIYSNLLGLRLLLWNKKEEAAEKGNPRVFYDANNRVRDRLRLVYSAMAREGLTNLFDTDSDGVFDNEDLFPTIPDFIEDRDHDFITDNEDLAPDDRERWNPLPDNVRVSSEKFDLLRVGKTTRIIVNIHLKSSVRELPADFSLRLKQTGEEFFLANREDKSENIRLEINFVPYPTQAHHIVDLRGYTPRMNSEKWDLSIAEQPSVLVHEIMHLAGIGDRYHETLVDGEIRDHATQPGYDYHNRNDLMNTGVQISLRDLRQVVVEGWKERLQQSVPGNWRSALTDDYYFSTPFHLRARHSRVLCYFLRIGHRVIIDDVDPAFSFPDSKEAPEDAFHQMEHIAHLSNNNNGEEARQRLAHLLDKHPDSLDCWLFGIRWFQRNGSEWEMEKILANALQKFPQEIVFHLIRLQILERQKKWEEWEKGVVELKEKYPGQPATRYFEAQFAAKNGDLDTLAKMINGSPEEEYWMWSRLDWLKGAGDRGRMFFDKIRRPRDQREICRNWWKPEEPEWCGSRRLKKWNPDDVRLIVSDLVERGKKEEATRAIRTLVSLNISSSGAWFSAAEASMKLGNIATALKYLSGAVITEKLHQAHRLEELNSDARLVDDFANVACRLSAIGEVERAIDNYDEEPWMEPLSSLNDALERVPRITVGGCPDKS